jgi:hypothetical protein
MKMSVFGFSTEPSAGGDFTPIVKFDARAGRVFRVDREQTADGFVSNPVDITQIFKAVVDFENVETGWMDFPPGSAPSFVLVQLNELSNGKSLPERPSPRHKNGIRFLLKLNKACGGDKPVREMAGTAKTFLAGVEEVYNEYLRERAKYPGQLPVVELASTMPVKSGSGAQQSTNYRPVFKISGWAQRPADLVYLRPSTAPVEPLKPTPPATGAQTVPPPNVMRQNGSQPQMADDDFG